MDGGGRSLDFADLDTKLQVFMLKTNIMMTVIIILLLVLIYLLYTSKESFLNFKPYLNSHLFKRSDPAFDPGVVSPPPITASYIPVDKKEQPVPDDYQLPPFTQYFHNSYSPYDLYTEYS